MYKDFNLKHYHSQIEELSKIIKSTDDMFIHDMHSALINGRKITPKMLNAINDIIKRNDPVILIRRKKWLDDFLIKLNQIKLLLESVTYKQSYKRDLFEFIDSLENQARTRLRLSNKQMESLNKIYKKLKKRYDKDLKSSGKNT